MDNIKDKKVFDEPEHLLEEIAFILTQIEDIEINSHFFKNIKEVIV